MNQDQNLMIPGNHTNLVNTLKNDLSQLSLKREKIVTKISSLEFKKKQIRPPQQVKYDLKGVIIHEGTVNYGHYYSYVKINNTWNCFNDLQVEKVTEEIVMKTGKGFSEKKSANCYCLVYLKGKRILGK
jgi:ubiquitin C-terminal hydrolase